jgi:hypothetical protein
VARSQGIPGVAVGAIAVGSLLLYAGIKDVSVVDALRAIVRGQLPQSTRAPATGLTPDQIQSLISSANATETLPRKSGRDPNAPGLK